VVRARWAIGCDGARSFVRKSCGIAWNSLGYDCDWLVVDVEVRRPVDLTPFCQQICDPERPVTVVPLPGRLRRWEFQLKPGETAAAMERHGRVWDLLGPWLSPHDGEIVRAVVYRFHATVAETFRRGRIFLAGDAAHQTPPFMGQGMCTGVRDVDNLAWKLAMVCSGRAGDRILDSYSAERRPLAVAMVEHSTNTGKLIDAYAAMARGGPEPPPELQEYAYGGSRRLPDLYGGLLADGDSDWVGRLVPWTVVRGDAATGPLDDVVGRRWALVGKDDLRERLDSESLQLLRDVDARPVSVPEPDGAILGLLLAHEAVVVRPDRVIYGVSAASDTGALLARLRAELDAPPLPCRASPANGGRWAGDHPRWA
jgi:3-(3-hydroxy-phenyl)propionate hydroxylase